MASENERYLRLVAKLKKRRDDHGAEMIGGVQSFDKYRDLVARADEIVHVLEIVKQVYGGTEEE